MCTLFRHLQMAFGLCDRWWQPTVTKCTANNSFPFTYIIWLTQQKVIALNAVGRSKFFIGFQLKAVGVWEGTAKRFPASQLPHEFLCLLLKS